MTPEQREAWFTYHAPTEETAPKYAAIREAERAVVIDVTQTSYEGVAQHVLHSRINSNCGAFADVIMANAPACDDRTAAIRCVRLARNYFNEWAAQGAKPAHDRDWTDTSLLFTRACLELCSARMQANSAIACNGV